MVCPTPDLNEANYTPESDIQNGGGRRKREAHGGDAHEQAPLNSADLEYYVSFKMDGVDNLDKVGEISVFKDPVYSNFAENYFLKYFHRSKNKHLYLTVSGMLLCNTQTKIISGLLDVR